MDDHGMIALRPCACGCGALVGQNAMIAGWRERCVSAILLDIRSLQNLPPAELAMVASLAHDAGALRLAKAIVGALPFEPTLERERLMQ